eukprot:1175716-Prorocentrum_minimum.AAC.1
MSNDQRSTIVVNGQWSTIVVNGQWSTIVVNGQRPIWVNLGELKRALNFRGLNGFEGGGDREESAG